MGKVVSICIGECRGKKMPVEKAYLRRGHGLAADIHAGPGKRQVSLLNWERVEEVRGQGIDAGPGDFAENIVLEGVDFKKLQPGTIFRVGPALLKVTERGKPEWREGDYSFKGLALMAREGVFARVLEDGWVKAGDRATIILDRRSSKKRE